MTIDEELNEAVLELEERRIYKNRLAISDQHFRLGHFSHVGNHVEFPHRCPCPDCAIARWIREHAR